MEYIKYIKTVTYPENLMQEMPPNLHGALTQMVGTVSHYSAGWLGTFMLNNY